MPCASAAGRYDETETFADEVANFDEASFFLAETQNDSISTAYEAIKLVDDHGVEDILSHPVHAVHAMEHDDHLLEYHTDIPDEAVSLLMPEMEPTAGMDCTDFVDFDEFNLCLTNILSDHHDVDLTRDDMLAVNTDAGHQNQSEVGGEVVDCNRLLAQGTQIDDILNVVQIGDESAEFYSSSSGSARRDAVNALQCATKSVGGSETVEHYFKHNEAELSAKKQHQTKVQDEDPVDLELDFIRMNSQGVVNMFQ